jgi:uncharacterized protein
LEKRTDRPGLAFATGAGAGAAGGLIGLGGAEFRLPVLLGPLGFSPREAVPVNLLASFVVLAVALPVRLWTVPMTEVAPHLVPLLGMLTGAVGAGWIGAGWVRRLPERPLGLAMLGLLVVLGFVLIAEGLLAQESRRVVGAHWLPEAGVALLCGIVIGLVSSLLGVAGGELIIPVFVLLFGIDAKVAGSMSAIVGLPTIAVGLARWLAGASVLRDRRVLRGTAAPLAAGSTVGALVGAALLGVVPADVLKVGLGAILIWSATRILGHLPAGHVGP